MSDIPSATLIWHEEISPTRIARKLADDVAKSLTAAVTEKDSALLAVSGGSTPLRFFKELSRRTLPWRNVTVILVDERFVPTESQRSNARLVAHNLLQNEAAAADFRGLYFPADNVEDAAAEAENAMKQLAFPPDVTVLGMGLDGHVASLFPKWSELALAMSLDNERFVMAVTDGAGKEKRLTLTLRQLIGSAYLALHIEGLDKKEVLLAAQSDQDPDSPIRKLIEHSPRPIHVYWAPSNSKKGSGLNGDTQ